MSKQCKYHITKEYVERISVEQDLDAAHPHIDDESLVGEMFCLHRRYYLGDETSYQDIGGLNRAMAKAADITSFCSRVPV